MSVRASLHTEYFVFLTNTILKNIDIRVQNFYYILTSNLHRHTGAAKFLGGEGGGGAVIFCLKNLAKKFSHETVDEGGRSGGGAVVGGHATTRTVIHMRFYSTPPPPPRLVRLCKSLTLTGLCLGNA